MRASGGKAGTMSGLTSATTTMNRMYKALNNQKEVLGLSTKNPKLPKFCKISQIWSRQIILLNKGTKIFSMVRNPVDRFHFVRMLSFRVQQLKVIPFMMQQLKGIPFRVQLLKVIPHQ